MSDGWAVLVAFVLGALITNIQWALIYSQHLREDRNLVEESLNEMP